MWTGVYPAATTQFAPDGSIDIDATQKVLTALVDDGVTGLILLGTCGENNSLDVAEKHAVLRAGVEAVGGRVPLVCGVSEFTTARASAFAREAEEIGMDGLMLLPAMVYVPTSEELGTHFATVAGEHQPADHALQQSAGLPRVGRLPDAGQARPDREYRRGEGKRPDPRRFTDIINRYGERYIVMAGLDDVALEGMLLGASGWVSGLTSAFPQESVALIKAVERGDWIEARRIYRWFMPLLHLDAEHDLVQSIKLAEEIMGRGSERVRLPRLPLAGARRAEVIAMVEKCAATRPLGDLVAA